MRLIYKFLLFLLSFSIAYADIKLPDVIFPLEIIAQKQEKKERLKPPKFLNIDETIQDVNIHLPPSYPVDLKPVFKQPVREKTFLGLPKEKALYNGIIDLYTTGSFILAEEKARQFLRNYSKNKNVPVILYILGLIEFELKNYNDSLNYFSKSCSMNSEIKNEACMSASVVSLLKSDLSKAKYFLKNVSLNTPEYNFLQKTVKILEKNKIILIKDVKCENLDVSFVSYCRYLKLHYLALSKPYKFFSDYRPLENYEKILKLLKGFAYLKEKKLNKAKNVFKDYLQIYSRADLYSKYPIFGMQMINLKEGNIKEVEENVGSLDIRDRYLAQLVYIKLGNEYFKRKDFKSTFAYYQKALTSYKTNKNLLKKLIAITSYNLGLYKYAYNIFKNINEDKYYLYTAFALLNLENYSEAEFYLKKAYKNASDEKIKQSSLKYLADIYYFNNDDTKFIATLRQIAKFDSKFASDMLGWYFFRKKKFEDAYNAFVDTYMKAVSAFNMDKEDTALKLIKNKNDRKSKFLKAYVYLKKLNLDKARKILRELAEGNDEIAKQAGYLYAYSFFSNEEYDKAYEEFKKFAEKYKNDPLGRRAVLRMADSLYNLGKEDEAKKIYTQFIKKYAGSKEAVDAAYLLTLLETKEAAEKSSIEKQLQSFVQKYPDYPKIDLLKLQLSEVYFKNGKKEKAFKTLEELVNKNSDVSQQALYKLGYYHYKLGNMEKAKKYFIEYILKYPKGKLVVPVKQFLATIYEKNGQIDEAVALYEQLPKTDENLYKLAVLYFKKGNYLKAKENFEKLYEKYPRYKNDIAYFLGYIQLKNGNIEEAKRYFEEAVKGSDYNKVAESYFILGNINEKQGNLEEALNDYINVIYLYSEAKELVLKSRIKAAKILEKQGKRNEASCMVEPVKNVENLDQDTKSFIISLPQCIKD